MIIRTIINKRGYYIYPNFCDKYACEVLIIAINHLGWLLLWQQEIQESFNLEGWVFTTQTEFAAWTRLSNPGIIKWIIVIIILNQIPLVLVDVLKDNIHPLFKRTTRISNSDIW